MENALAIAIISLMSNIVMGITVHLKNMDQDKTVRQLSSKLAVVEGHHEDCVEEVKTLRELIASEGHNTANKGKGMP